MKVYLVRRGKRLLLGEVVELEERPTIAGRYERVVRLRSRFGGPVIEISGDVHVREVERRKGTRWVEVDV